MIYYRYRPANELSIKELLYDEIYFGSSKENNDPYDGRQFYFFDKDVDKWKRLFECAWSKTEGINYSKWAKSLACILAEKSPMSFQSAIDFDYIHAFHTMPNPPDFINIIALSSLIKTYIDLYRPQEGYFASFSRSCDNHLMWSHYASMYQGYCLLFKSINGELKQCPQRMRQSLYRPTKRGKPTRMSWSAPSSFAFEDVFYNDSTSCSDAFLRFPQSVSACSFEEQERLELIKSQNRQYLEKNIAWSYEQESRLLLMSPSPWLSGNHVSLTKQERLFHYQATQLVGIILGPLMQSDYKQRIQEIVELRMQRLDLVPDDAQVELFDFVVFEARLSDEVRNITIEPVRILSGTEEIEKDDPGFIDKYTAWNNGWAIVFDGKRGAKRKQIL